MNTKTDTDPDESKNAMAPRPPDLSGIDVSALLDAPTYPTLLDAGELRTSGPMLADEDE